ncbi:MAG TPA: LLM class flavin-dependent oxidoreductase [Candidatus Limnocylindrales bacterium]|nr:LLM class flavin-dependent oxidoreductase [Candidatus Limnocylindrales bacterium]
MTATDAGPAPARTTASGPRIGIALPQELRDREPAGAAIARYARRAERLGFDGLWTQESVRGAAPTLEPLTLLAAVAGVTSRVELGVATVLSAYRSPIQLARATASLDALSGGRLVLGVALGERGLEDGFGMPAGSRVRRFVEGIELLRHLWSEDRVTWSGEIGRLVGWPTGLRPVQPGGPRLLIGGHHPRALARAVSLGDGWVGAGGQSIAQFLDDLRIVRELLDGRPEARPFETGKRVYLAVGRRRADDRRRLREWFGRRQGDPDRADRVAIASDAAGLVEALRPLVAAGTDRLILSPLFDERRQLETIAADVMPYLRPGER